MGAFWLTRVYFGDEAPGNFTGVLTLEGLGSAEECQATARRLGLPDTGFVALDGSGSPRLLSFSPAEELRFCTQVLLATAAVLSLDVGSATQRFATGVGEVEVSGEGDGMWWVKAEPDPAKVLPESSPLLEELGIDQAELAGVVCASGIGRQRAYIPLRSEASLCGLHPGREQVMRICRERGLSAICPFLVRGMDEVGLRVFTTSLGGAEDAATGGAALGLLGCDQLQPLGLGSRARVAQGHPDTLQRGRLFIRRAPAGVGGHVEVLARGDLLP